MLVEASFGSSTLVLETQIYHQLDTIYFSCELLTGKVVIQWIHKDFRLNVKSLKS